MKIWILPGLSAVAMVLLIAAPAAAEPGDPIPGTSVGLEHDPEPIVVASGTTDAKGAVAFTALRAGPHIPCLTEAQAVKVPVIFTVTDARGRRVVSAPLPPGQTGKACAADATGRRLVFTADKDRRITIRLTEARAPRLLRSRMSANEAAASGALK